MVWTIIKSRRSFSMATCNNCKAPYYLDFKNGGELEMDQKTPHKCKVAVAVVNGLPQTAREKRIEELALKKIDAINSIASAIRELAKAIQQQTQQGIQNKIMSIPKE
jgi:hypothetical protein